MVISRAEAEQNDVRETIVPVPRWGGDVRLVRVAPFELATVLDAVMSDEPGDESLDDEPDDQRNPQAREFFAQLLSRQIRNEAGEAEFDNESGREWLRNVDADTFARLNEAGLDLQGMADDDEAVDPAKKN